MITKLIIAGGRDFQNMNLLHKSLCELGKAGHISPDAELVCGMAPGADRLGYEYFKSRNCPIREFKPDWSIGKQAGYIRNSHMGTYCDGGLIFWDGQSKGTKHMIDILIKLNKPHWVIPY